MQENVNIRDIGSQLLAGQIRGVAASLAAGLSGNAPPSSSSASAPLASLVSLTVGASPAYPSAAAADGGSIAASENLSGAARWAKPS